MTTARAEFDRRVEPGRALAADAERIAQACHAMAERFQTGGKLVVFGSGTIRLWTGFDPDVVVSGLDEETILGQGPGPLALARAEAKAEAVAARAGMVGAVIVGCDSILDVDEEGFGRPANLDQTRTWLSRLRGRSGVLRTGHCLVDGATGRRASAVAATEVRFASFTPAELEAYLATGEPLHVAGSFTLDGWFAPFVEGIVGDHGTVIGLSLPLLRRLLADVGLTVMDLWRAAP